METVRNAAAVKVVADLVTAINANRAYLSEIDGAIGDGDHGINMSKGFTAAGAKLAGVPDLTGALQVLGDTLLEDIGGSMGPLYGSFFGAMSETLGSKESLDAETFGAMLAAGLSGVQELGSAKPGDKTLLDALVPAKQAFEAARQGGAGFAACLSRMTAAAEQGRDATRDMVARVGRASRLGERSRGVLDAGATSCCLILESMAASLRGALGA